MPGALPLARICAVFPIRWPTCGDAIRIVTFVTDASTGAILAHLGAATAPPPVAPARVRHGGRPSFRR